MTPLDFCHAVVIRALAACSSEPLNIDSARNVKSSVDERFHSCPPLPGTGTYRAEPPPGAVGKVMFLAAASGSEGGVWEWFSELQRLGW